MNELKPALCLDLDGTVRRSTAGDFINKPEDVELFPDVEPRLWEYYNEGWLIFGVSNQGGVAFGYKTPEGCEAEIDAMVAQFDNNPFHFIQTCFFHEAGSVEPFNHRSLLRKPAYGMLAVCEAEANKRGWAIDWSNSLVVGDRLEDKEMADRADVDFQWARDFFERED